MIHRLSGATLNAARVKCFELVGIKLIVVSFKSPLESPGGIQHEGTDEGSSCIVVAFESLGNKTNARAQRGAGEITNAVPRRVGSAQNHSVRGQCDGHEGQCVIKTDALGSERVNGWSFDVAGAIAAHMVGSHGVHCDQQN